MKCFICLILKSKFNYHLASVKNFLKNFTLVWPCGKCKNVQRRFRNTSLKFNPCKKAMKSYLSFHLPPCKKVPLPSTCNCMLNSKQTHRLPNIWLSYLVVTQALSPWSSKREGGKDDAAAVAFRSKNFSCKTFRTKERNWSVPWGQWAHTFFVVWYIAVLENMKSIVYFEIWILCTMYSSSTEALNWNEMLQYWGKHYIVRLLECEEAFIDRNNSFQIENMLLCHFKENQTMKKKSILLSR